MALHDRTRRSRMYQEALRMASEYLNDPQKMDDLLNRAGKKAEKKQGPLNNAWQQAQTLMSMLNSYRKGEYRDVSSKTVLLIVAALLYFVMPADLIPDFIIGLGYLDDVALLAWTYRQISDELEKFEHWQKLQESYNSRSGKHGSGSAKKKGAGDDGLLIEGELAD